MPTTARRSASSTGRIINPRVGGSRTDGSPAYLNNESSPFWIETRKGPMTPWLRCENVHGLGPLDYLRSVVDARLAERERMLRRQIADTRQIIRELAQ